jgi:hypothetical protein
MHGKTINKEQSRETRSADPVVSGSGFTVATKRQ